MCVEMGEIKSASSKTDDKHFHSVHLSLSMHTLQYTYVLSYGCYISMYICIYIYIYILKGLFFTKGLSSSYLGELTKKVSLMYTDINFKNHCF